MYRGWRTRWSGGDWFSRESLTRPSLMIVDMTDVTIQGVLSPADVRTINKNIDVLTGIVAGLDDGVRLPDPRSKQAVAARRAALLAPPADSGLDLSLIEARCDRVQLLVTSLFGDPRWLVEACDLQLALCDVLIDVFGLTDTAFQFARRQFGPLGPTGELLPPEIAAEALTMRLRGRSLVEITSRFDLGDERAADWAVRQGIVNRLVPLAATYRPVAVEQLEVPLPVLFAGLDRPPRHALRAARQIVTIIRRHAVLVGLLPSPAPQRRSTP
jgi:hypothetical protein